MSILQRQNIFFPFALRFAVNTDRFGDVLLGVRFPFRAVENVIGTEMNQFCFLAEANFGEMLRRFRVDRKRSLGLRFGKIDIRKRRGVDQHIESQLVDIVMNLADIREIELGVIESDDVEFLSIRTRERSTETAASAQDYDSHRLVTSGTFEQRLPPGLIVDVPLDAGFEPFLEILARFPFQFLLRE